MLSTILYILAGIGVLFVLLILIGIFSEDESSNEELSQENKTINKEREAELSRLRASAPSVIRNSIIIGIIQLFSLLASIAFLVLGIISIIKLFDPAEQWFTILSFVASINFFLIYSICKMVRLRNKYIEDLNDFIDRFGS